MGNGLWDWINNILLEWIQKLKPPHFVAVVIMVLALCILRYQPTKVFLYGPEWTYSYDGQAEETALRTDTELKSGRVVVQPQLEFKYNDKVVCIVEIRGLYEKNEAVFNEIKSDSDQGEEKKRENAFYMIIKDTQREKLDRFKSMFENMLKEYCAEQYKEEFDFQQLEVSENQLAEIRYQDVGSNRTKLMYVFISEEETRTITENEVIMRSTSEWVDLDELDLDRSFYDNDNIKAIIEKCMEGIDKS